MSRPGSTEGALTNRARWPTVVAAVLISGAMFSLSTGIVPCTIAAWLAPVPLLIVLVDLPWTGALLAALMVHALGALSLVSAYYGKFPTDLLVSIAPMVAVPLALVDFGWRLMARRTDPLTALFAYPSLVVTREYLSSLTSPNGMFGSLANSQGDLPVVLQLAAFSGSWGVSFLIALVSSALALSWRHRAERRQLTALLVAGAVPLTLALGIGALRLSASRPEKEIWVGLAATDAGAGRTFAFKQEADALPVVRTYASLASRLADQGAKAIVLPEKFVGVTPDYADKAITLLAAVAAEKQVTIVAGFNFLGADEKRNLAIVIGPEGKVVREYDKRHLVPGFEAGYREGNQVGVIPETAPPMGVAICKDLDFVSLGFDNARAGVGLLLVSAWDFENDGWIHSRMAVVRGVEGGFAIARSAIEGRLTVSDAMGRIVAERLTKDEPEAMLVARVPIGSGGTFYSRTGDWFAWLCLGATLGCAASAMKRGRIASS